MAGRRRGYGGAGASSLDLASKLLLHRQEQEQARREKATELYTKFKVEMAQKEYERTGAYTDPFTGKPVGTPRAIQAPEGLEPYEYDPSKGVTTYRRPAGGLTGVAEQALIGAEEPGHPFSGSVPVSPQALSTLQRGIEQGRFESPSVTALPALEPSASGISFPKWIGDAARAISARSLGGSATRPPAITTPQRLPARLGVPSLTSDVRAALAEGFSLEDIQEQLQQLGVSPEDIEVILSQAGT